MIRAGTLNIVRVGMPDFAPDSTVEIHLSAVSVRDFHVIYPTAKYILHVNPVD
jgi:hypothetical protein